MRIIGGKDFYDNALSFGRDEDIVLVRHKEEFRNYEDMKFFREVDHLTHLAYWHNGFNSARLLFQNNSPINFEIQQINIIFCGKKYNGIYCKQTNAEKEYFFWNFEEFENFLTKHGKELRYKSLWNGYVSDRDSFKYYFENHELSAEAVAWLIDNKISILTHGNPKHAEHNKEWYLNPFHLKDFHFYKVFDAFIAFQELSMWVGNLGQSGGPMVEIADDKVKIHKHGFDKFSFRKPKQS